MKRLECLDGLRGVLAVYVMISHMAPFAPLPGWIARPLSHGGAAVDVFFILSGLVIVGSLEKFRYRARPFLIARVARIYPVFLAVFAVSLLVHALPSGLERMTWLSPDSLAWRMWASGWPSHWPVDLAAHLTMTHGLFPNVTYPYIWLSLLGPAWSLSTEWQFYLLALLLGGWLARRGAVAWRLAWLLIGLGVAGALWAITVPEPWGFSRAFLGNKAGYFGLGVMSALVVAGDPRGWRLYAIALAAILALCWWQGGAGKLAAPLVWTLCLMAQLAPRGALAPLAAMLRSAPLRWLGAISYGVYLVNEPVQRLLGLVLAWVAEGDATLFAVFWLPLAVALPIIAAHWLHRTVERPGQRAGRLALSTTETIAPGSLGRQVG